MRQKVNIGDRVGQLTLESYHSTVRKHKRYLWRCDCGGSKIQEIAYIMRTPYKTCSICSFKKMGDNRRSSDNTPLKKNRISHYKKSARVRGYTYTLTDKEAIKLLEGNCTYCGVEPSCSQKDNSTVVKREFKWNGIDRVNNNLGYIVSNCVSCCGRCNKAKHTMTRKEFIALVQRIYYHLIKPNEAEK